MKIAHKLIVGMMVSAVLIWAVSYYATTASERSLRDAIERTSAARAIAIMDEIDRVMRDRVAEWMAHCRSPLVQRTLAASNREFQRMENRRQYIDQQDRLWRALPQGELNTLMERLMTNELAEDLRARLAELERGFGYQVVAEAFYTNRYGANVAQTNRTTDYRQDDEDWWQSAKRDGVYVGDVDYDDSAGVYSTDICLRVEDAQGTFQGVLKVVLNIQEVIATIDRRAAAHTVEAGSHLILFTADHKIIHASHEAESLLVDGSRYFRHLDLSSRQEAITVERKDPVTGCRYLSAYAFSQGHGGFKGLGWILLLEHEADQVFQPVLHLRNNILLMAVATTLVSILFGGMIAASMSRRIKRLTHATIQLGRGNLDATVSLRGRDELAQLARSFNQMAGELKQAREELEAQARAIENKKSSLEREIADRKRAETQLQKLSRVIEQSPTSVVITNTEGTIEYVNPRFTQVTGYSRQEAVGQNPRLVKSGKTPVETYKQMWATITAGREWRGELLNRKKNGELFWEWVSISPITNADGVITNFVGVEQEITRRKQAEAALQKLNKRLVETSRLVGKAEIASSVLHNVGNVLNSVNVSSGLIRDRLRNSGLADLTKAIAVMEEHLDDLATYITQDERGKHLPQFLIDLSRRMAADEQTILEELQSLTSNIEHIKSIIALQQSHTGVSGLIENVALAEVLEDAIRINMASAERHRIEIVQQLEDLPPVAADRQKLLQILVNLISNAKYALIESDQPDRQIVVRLLRAGDDRVRIEVQDNGVGIPAENLTRIFSHGFTTREEGHGFGLHSAALAAKEMGGVLTAHSDGPGAGATFTLEIPVKLTGATRCTIQADGISGQTGGSW